MDRCNKFDMETISCFVDGELDAKKQKEVSTHLLTCHDCFETAEMYKRIAHGFKQRIKVQKSIFDDPAFSNKIMTRIREKKQKQSMSIFKGKSHFLPFIRFLEFFTPGKIPLQMASFAAIVIFSLGLFQFHKYFFTDEKRPGADGNGPSAIINSVSGDLASLMILETEDHKHTIIWYTES